MESPIVIVHQFQRSQIESCDCSVFLGRYSLDKLPTGPALGKMLGCFAFEVAGYDQDPREIFMIPEIKNFYRKLTAKWPYLFYFNELDLGTLQPVLYCCLKNLQHATTDASSRYGVRPHRLEFANYLSKNFASMNEVCHRAQLPEIDISERTKEICRQFNISSPPSTPRF